MIRIDRGPEPPEVAAQRAERLPVACAAFDAQGVEAPAFKRTLTGYDAGKPILYLRQHKKCAYCERKPGLRNQPLEHFRPIKEAWRHVPRDTVKRVEPGYWWLTWTWENQLFACTTCNGRGAKANHFPLEDGTLPMTQPVRPCGGRVPTLDRRAESPLLLDPSDPEGDDPIDHLRWIPDERSLPLKLWSWKLAPRTRRGDATRRLLHLHELEDDVNDVYKTKIWPAIEPVMNALRRHDEAEARRAWSNALELVDRRAAFTAATWSQLDVLRSHLCERFGVSLATVPRPS